VSTWVHLWVFEGSVLHIFLVLSCVLVVCCGVFPCFVLFFVLLCFVCFFFALFCLSSSYVLCAQYRQCLCIVHSWLFFRFSLTFIFLYNLFIIRDSKVVIMIIATFVQPGNRRKGLRNQSGNQKPYIERQTTQWPQKGRKDKQWSTKHYKEN
jgi:hypothetical protein